MAGPGMLNRWAARTPGAPRHERTARGSVQLRRDRAPAATCWRSSSHGDRRRVGRRDGATCLPRRWATRCRQVIPGDGTTRAPRTPARRRCPGLRTFWATAICWAGVARLAEEAYRPPPLASQLLSELQAAVKAVAGAGGPVPAGLARRDRRPVRPAGRRRRRAGGLRRRGRSRRRAGQAPPGPAVPPRWRPGRRRPATPVPGVSPAGPAAGLLGSGPDRYLAAVRPPDSRPVGRAAVGAGRDLRQGVTQPDGVAAGTVVGRRGIQRDRGRDQRLGQPQLPY